MNKRLITIAAIAAICSSAMAQKSFNISVNNPSKTERKATPVVLNLDKYGINVKAAVVEIGTASGDVNAASLMCTSANLHTASGDIDAVDCSGEFLEAGTASGDISVKAAYKKYSVKTSSGEISVESSVDADVFANSTSGDVDVHLTEALETYQVSMHSVSGECNTYGQTKSESSVPTRTIEAKTISGEINVRFL